MSNEPQLGVIDAIAASLERTAASLPPAQGRNIRRALLGNGWIMLVLGGIGAMALFVAGLIAEGVRAFGHPGFVGVALASMILPIGGWMMVSIGKRMQSSRSAHSSEPLVGPTKYHRSRPRPKRSPGRRSQPRREGCTTTRSAGKARGS